MQATQADSKADRLIAVAMSGGVDSSAAALLLQKQGYRVIGLTMKLWSPPPCDDDPADVEKTCCTADSAMDAKRVCDQIGIPHYTLDMQEDFEERVIRPFTEAYLAGETPNPCVNCNSFVKWDALWQRARAVGADAIATGHYAATIEHDGKTFIRRGDDPAKDQSYFLWGVPPETLAQTLFPLGGLAKPAVRDLAREAGLRTADKRESQDICFVPKGDYRAVVAERAQREGRAILPGPIRDPDGKVVGEHKGLAFYTIGQRRGVDVAAGEPVYVKRIDTATNTLELGRKSDLECRAFWADRHNDFEGDWETRVCEVQYRYRSKPVPGKLTRHGDGRVLVELESPGLGVCPGQSAVFYEGNRLLGGARIRETL